MFRFHFQRDIIDDDIKIWITHRVDGKKYFIKFKDDGAVVSELLTESCDIPKNPSIVLDEAVMKEFITGFIEGAKRCLGYEVETEVLLKGKLEIQGERLKDTKEQNNKMLEFIMGLAYKK